MSRSPRNPLNQETSPEYRSEEQEENDTKNRRKALIVTIDYAQAQRVPAEELLDLVDMLGLEEELVELAGGDPQRQRLLVDVRAQLELKGSSAGGHLE